MFVIWGFGNRNKNTKILVFDGCDACGNANVMTIYKTYSCFTLFFIPIICWGTKYFIVCSRCGAGKQISKQEFNDLRNTYKTTGQPVQLPANMVQNNVVLEEVKPVVEAKPQVQEKSLNTLITEEIDKTMAKVKANQNYILTEDKINKLKIALKQNLIKKFGEERIVEIAIEQYFSKLAK